MSLFGHRRTACRITQQLTLILLLLAAARSTISGQTPAAPYVLPYTMQTYAGANAAYNVGKPCANSSTLTALDLDGDGCLASQASINTDPHDIRVDPFGFVYYADNGNSLGLIHRINPYTGLFTIYYGNAVGNSKLCAGASAVTGKSGVNCTSTDGVANSGPFNLLTTSTGAANGPFYAVNTGALRGLGVDGAGNLFVANYGQDLVESIAAVGHKVGLVTGEYHAPGLINGQAYVDNTTEVSAARGVGIDGAGNLYIADTGNSLIRLVTNGQISNFTSAANTAGTTFSNTNAVAYGNVILNSPEDAQVDLYGNIFIADQGNDLVRVIYHGAVAAPGAPTQTSFFGIASPVVGNTYVIAGNFLAPPVSVSCPAPTSPKAGSPANATAYASGFTLTNGVSNTVSATSVPIAIRKLGLDARGNVYLADSCNGVVFFIDATTGGMRVIAGLYADGGQTGQTTAPPATVLCAASTDAVGDGCPGPQSSLDPNANMGSQPDTLGNLYITDSEANTANLSRIRKLTSGLSFPLTAPGTTVKQQVLLHFAVGDTPAITTPYTVTGSDFALSGAAACSKENDNTTDCVVTLAFTPTVSGPDFAQLTVTSQAGATAQFQITGSGSAPTLAFDPGNTSLFPVTTANPQGIALDGAGDAYIADTGNNQVLFYNSASGSTSVFVAPSAGLKAPLAVALGTDGSLYIADTGNNLIRKASPAGSVTTIAGGGAPCTAATDAFGDNCLATQATFANPSGLATDSLGNLFVADTGNNLIREIGTTGFVQLLAGGATSLCPVSPYPTPTPTDSVGDGCAALNANFSAPSGLAFDPTGANLFVADKGNNIVRKIHLSTAFSINGTGGSALASGIAVNPVTLVAGNLSAGSTLDTNYLATNSQLSAPTGVAVSPSGTVYIADSGNHAVRLVTNGVISTIAGILGTRGTGTFGTANSATQLNTPGGVALLPNGTLYISDSGNNRIVTDNRTAVSYNFGVINVGSTASPQNYTELNLGTTAATLPSPLFTETPANTQLTLTPTALNNSSIPACTSGALASAAICGLQAQFAPTTLANDSAAFTQTATGSTAAAAITLTGSGLTLTPTTSTITQSTPATGNPVFGGPLTVQVAVTANSCSPVAPTCTPAGTVTFITDGQPSAPVAFTPGSPARLSVPGLSVGPHTFTCSYTSTDGFYASSSCGNLTITVIQAPTTSVLAATNSNAPQYLNTACVTNSQSKITTCTVSTLTATVSSTTIGTPNGNVTFYSNGTALGTTSLNGSGIATFALAYSYDSNGNLTSDNTLAPGSYNLTCTYAGSGNFSGSSCATVKYAVVVQAQTITLTPRGCIASALIPAGSSAAALGQACPAPVTTNGIPTVATADGSTTDATIFITPNNTVSGTFTFSCSGMPAATDCTFSPTSLAINTTTSLAPPVYFDVTFFTDLQSTTSALRKPNSSVQLATILGWPLTFAGLLSMLTLRRRKNLRGLSLLATAVLLLGSALTFSGCAGPGNYQAVLTPAGTYPITITVTNGTTKASTVVDFTVTAPGIAGQQ